MSFAAARKKPFGCRRRRLSSGSFHSIFSSALVPSLTCNFVRKRHAPDVAAPVRVDPVHRRTANIETTTTTTHAREILFLSLSLSLSLSFSRTLLFIYSLYISFILLSVLCVCVLSPAVVWAEVGGGSRWLMQRILPCWWRCRPYHRRICFLLIFGFVLAQLSAVSVAVPNFIVFFSLCSSRGRLPNADTGLFIDILRYWFGYVSGWNKFAPY